MEVLVMEFIKNANKKIEGLLKRDNVVEIYDDMVKNLVEKRRTVFVEQLQVYVTKIGIILSDCAKHVKLTNNNYSSSVNYICDKIIYNQKMNLNMRFLRINDNGNLVKHSIEDVELYMDELKNEYNNFIKEIINVTGFTALNKCLIVIKPSTRDIPLITEEKHHKYFAIDKCKFQLKICPKYSIDRYTKKISSKLTLYWPQTKYGYYARVRIINPINNRIISEKRNIDLNENILNQRDGKYAIQLNFSEADLDRRVLNLMVDVDITKKVTESRSYYPSYNRHRNNQTNKMVKVGTYSCTLSQIFRPEARI